ncbi:hypothetical protein [Chryseobacterium contaminans]|uniref:Lipoprotein n=1 Tax=Chryseobacterium contaminans TaxID=1423959 RepID=A0A1M7CQX6_9FLAO|nr:hypothetical protein [Chryseobacterium contaminans]SHL69602.1 hypothetical protein SAMN05444407_105330 [Chryseobacterium contaminans]
MKTTAIILGVLGLFSFASCRCNLEEDEQSDKKKDNIEVNKNAEAKNDTLNIR